MKRNKFRFVSIGLAMAIVLAISAPFETQYAMILPPDPEGEAGVAYTLTNTSGDPTGTATAAYVLDNEDVVINADLLLNTNMTGQYRADYNLDNNTYAVTTLS